jgi:antitoxin (DNA-binding transcriptional repressor) of toxin-antitoxin stability system
MFITPVSALINSIRAQHNLEWLHLVAELVDNAQDAGAKSVTLDFSVPGKFSASDDGCGCADLRLMLSPGSRQDHPTTQAGRFGIGAKDAMICLADEVSLTSTCLGVRRTAYVNWRSVVTKDSWQVDDPVEVPSAGPSGTTILLGSLTKPVPNKFDSAHYKLGALYAPAIASGAFRILLRYRAGKGPKARIHFESVPPIASPRLDHEEAADFAFPHSKSARVRMGIIAEPGQRVHQGVTVAIPTRVIKVRTRLGLGLDPTPGLYGYVELSRGWSLSKNKDDLSADDKDLLSRVIADRFSALIARARKSGEDVALAGCNRALALISTAIRRERDRTRKARRSPPANHTGTVLPTGLGTPHTQAARTQPGNRFAAPLGSPEKFFSLQPEARKDAPLFMLEEGMIVYVNTDHDFCKYVDGNLEKLAPVATLFVASQLPLRGQQKFTYPDDVQTIADKHAWACSYLLERYVEAQRLARGGDTQAV